MFFLIRGIQIYELQLELEFRFQHKNLFPKHRIGRKNKAEHTVIARESGFQAQYVVG